MSYIKSNSALFANLKTILVFTILKIRSEEGPYFTLWDDDSPVGVYSFSPSNITGLVLDFKFRTFLLLILCRVM